MQLYGVCGEQQMKTLNKTQVMEIIKQSESDLANSMSSKHFTSAQELAILITLDALRARFAAAFGEDKKKEHKSSLFKLFFHRK